MRKRKIYRQWCSIVKPVMALFVFILECLLLAFGNGADMEDVKELLSMAVTLILLYVILYAFNRLIHGKTIAEIGEDRMWVRNRVILYKDIKKLRYETGVPPRWGRMINGDWYSKLEITTEREKMTIMHAPRSLEWYLKIKSHAKIIPDWSFWLIAGVTEALVILIAVCH